MSNKRMKEIKNLSKEEMALRLKELHELQFKAKLAHTTGQLENTASLWRVRKDIARMNTILSQLSKSTKESRV